ncbi:hypothetical protein HanPSC8_Chr12g0543261 [Helianthus annuus]|nr:hypothetical protein HanPSC8_Chr12g0543261 [Helianthus annuus]
MMLCSFIPSQQSHQWNHAIEFNNRFRMLRTKKVIRGRELPQSNRGFCYHIRVLVTQLFDQRADHTRFPSWESPGQ